MPQLAISRSIIRQVMQTGLPVLISMDRPIRGFSQARASLTPASSRRRAPLWELGTGSAVCYTSITCRGEACSPWTI